MKKRATAPANGAAPVAANASGKAIAPAVSGKAGEVLNVTSNLSKDDLVVRTVVGTYLDKGESHGKRWYQKQEQIPEYEGLEVFLYFWDERDGKDFTGWWFGDKVGGFQVFARTCTLPAAAAASVKPPRIGWKVPWDAATVVPGALVVQPKVPEPKLSGARIAAAKASPVAPKIGDSTATKLATATATTQINSTWKPRIDAAIQQVDDVLAGAKKAINAAKMATHDDDKKGLVDQLQQQQEALKLAQESLTEETSQAKADGPSATSAFLALQKLSPRLRTVQATLAIELKKFKTFAMKGEAQDKMKPAVQEKDINELLPVAVEAVSTAEDALESVGLLISPLMANMPDEIDDSVKDSIAEVEKATIEAQHKITTAGRATNLAIQTLKKRGPVTSDMGKGILDELTGLQAKLQESTKKLAPFKRFKQDFQLRVSAKKTMQALADKVTDADVEVEKIALMVKDDMSPDNLAAVDALIAKTQPAVTQVCKLLELKLKSSDDAALKEELEPSLARAEESGDKLKQLVGEVAKHRDTVKAKQLIAQCIEKVEKAEEQIKSCDETEAPFQGGADELNEEVFAKALKASEDSVGKAEKVIAHARGWLKQKLVDARRLPGGLAACTTEEIVELQTRLDELNKKLVAATKDTFEHKYTKVVGEVLVQLSAAEEAIEKLKEAAEPLDTLEDTSPATVKAAGCKAQAAEKDASHAVAEAKKGLDAKINELKGKSARAVSQMQSRLQNVNQELARLRKVTTSADKVIKTKAAIAEEKHRLQAVEGDVEKVNDIAGRDEISQEFALELEASTTGGLKTLKTVAKTLEELLKTASASQLVDVKDLITRNKKAQKALEDARVSSKGKREDALCGAFVRDIEKKVIEAEAALEAAGDAELPFLSGVEVLPVEEATTTLAACDKAASEASAVISKARTFMTAKTLEIKRFNSEVSKASIDEIAKQQDRMKGLTDRLNRFKKDVAGHRRLADLEAASLKLTIAEAEVAKTLEGVMPCKEIDSSEVTAETASKVCENVSELSAVAQQKLDEVHALLNARQKDTDKDESQMKTLHALKERFDKAGADLAAASHTANDYESKFVAKQLIADATERIKATEDAFEEVTKACAPLLELGGAEFLVAAAAQMVFEALRTYMASQELTIEDLFKKVSGGDVDSSIDENRFTSYLGTLPQALGREDLTFSEERRKAISQHTAGSAGSISIEKFKEHFRRHYKVIKTITITPNFAIEGAKTLTKVPIGEVLEALGEVRKDEATGLTRMECKMPSKGVIGWVTSQGNQGTMYLEAISPYSTFVHEIEKQIEVVVQSATTVVNWTKGKCNDLAAVLDGALKEARAELTKLKPKAIEIQSRLEKLKRQVGASKKEYAKKEESERNAHSELKERLEAEAIIGPAKEKLDAVAATIEKLDEASKPLLSLKECAERQAFATPLTLQGEIDVLAATLGNAISEAQVCLKEQTLKAAKASGKGPMLKAKGELTKMKQKTEAAASKCSSTTKAIASACAAIAEFARTKIQKALRDEAVSLGVPFETYFDKLSGGGDSIAEEKMVEQLKSLRALGLDAEHATLGVRRIQGGSIGKRKFMQLLQVYFIVVKDIAITRDFAIGKDKPIRKAEIGEVIEMLEGPQSSEELGMPRIRGRSLKDGLEGWITVSGNKGTPFLNECEKPYCVVSRDIQLEKDAEGKDGDIRPLKSEELLELVEGPRKLHGEFDDVLRARVKAMKDGAQGFITVRDHFGTIYAEASDKHYVCAAVTGITDSFEMDKCKVMRKLVVGELLVALDEPREEEEKKIVRVQAKALKDETIGWVALTGAKASTVYLKASTKHYVIRKDAVLNKQSTGEGQSVRTLEEGETVEVLVGPKSEKVEAPVRLKVRTFGDDTVGWVSAGGTRPCKPYYKCKKATPIHESIQCGADAKVVRQLDVDEIIELVEGPKEMDEGVLRIKGRAEKDGASGWLTIKEKSVTYVAAA